jgi:hypothetical protein
MAVLVIVAQQLGWSRVGHALAVVAVPVGRVVWLAVKVGWPALLAVVASLLIDMRSRQRLLVVATRVRRGMAGPRWLAIVSLVVGVAGLLALGLLDCWRAGQVKGLELGGVSVEEARALGRPPMGYLREQLRDRLAREISRQYLRWLHPTSRRRADETFL